MWKCGKQKAEIKTTFSKFLLSAFLISVLQFIRGFDGAEK